MTRRNRSIDVAQAVGPLGGLIVLAGLVFPSIRPMVSGFWEWALMALGLVMMGLAVFFAYRIYFRRTGHRLPIVSGSCDELISKLRSVDWFQFEKLIALVYQKLGYTVVLKGGAKPDGGIDIIIEKQDELIAIQCKHWAAWKVGVRQIRELLGAMTHSAIPRGKLITLCGYTNEAKQLADEHNIEILAESELAQLLQTIEASNDPNFLSILYDTRKYCPKCEAEMVQRTAKQGEKAGQPFWGCTNYPRCRFTLPVN